MAAGLCVHPAWSPPSHPVTGWFAGVSINPMACQAWASTGAANVAVPNCCEVHVEPVLLDQT